MITTWNWNGWFSRWLAKIRALFVDVIVIPVYLVKRFKIWKMKVSLYLKNFIISKNLFAKWISLLCTSQVNWPRQTDREARISLHVFVTDFVAVISSKSEGLGKMALGIVKIYLGSPFPANQRCSRSIGSRSVVEDPLFRCIYNQHVDSLYCIL